jgi:hypothetical protein
MVPILRGGLPASGIAARTFPRAVVYAPICYQGLAVPNLYTSQGVYHIQRIIRYCKDPDDITGGGGGQLLRAGITGATQTRSGDQVISFIFFLCSIRDSGNSLLANS